MPFANIPYFFYFYSFWFVTGCINDCENVFLSFLFIKDWLRYFCKLSLLFFSSSSFSIFVWFWTSFICLISFFSTLFFVFLILFCNEWDYLFICGNDMVLFIPRVYKNIFYGLKFILIQNNLFIEKINLSIIKSKWL